MYNGLINGMWKIFIRLNAYCHFPFRKYNEEKSYIKKECLNKEAVKNSTLAKSAWLKIVLADCSEIAIPRKKVEH